MSVLHTTFLMERPTSPTWLRVTPDEDQEFPFKDDPLRTVLGLFKSDTFDRTSLAVSKVIARYDVGETTMTVSEMEHRRKLTPKFIAFLQSYIKILVEAETEEANAIELTKKDAEAMAREALASLGSAKGASDAAAFVKSVVAGHMRDNQFNLVKQCERSNSPWVWQLSGDNTSINQISK